LPRPPPSGFPMDQSSGNIYVYADCKNLPQEVISQAPKLGYSEPGYISGSFAKYAGCLDPSSPPKNTLNSTNLIVTLCSE